MKTTFTIFFLSLGLFAVAQPVMINGVSANQMTRYFISNNEFSKQCDPQLLQAYKENNILSIRVPISNQVLYQATVNYDCYKQCAIGPSSVLNPDRLTALDTGVIQRMINAGFTVILDMMHPLSGKDTFQRYLYMNQYNAVQNFVDYCVAVVQYFQKYDPDKLVFEIMNEPPDLKPAFTPQTWYDIENSVIAAIRKINSTHWLVVSGVRNDASYDGLNNNLNTLYKMPAFNFPKLIYNFHFYQPYLFVFQGRLGANDQAPWHLPFPAYAGSTDAFEANPLHANGIWGKKGWGTLYKLWEYQQPPLWDKHRVDSIFDIIKAWSVSHGHVPIWCGEMMCFDYVIKGQHSVDRESRLNWFRIVIGSMRQHGFGFCLWDPDGAAVRIVDHYNGPGVKTPVFDKELLQAAGF